MWVDNYGLIVTAMAIIVYSVSAGFDGVYIHSIGVHIDCCILRRRN